MSKGVATSIVTGAVEGIIFRICLDTIEVKYTRLIFIEWEKSVNWFRYSGD